MKNEYSSKDIYYLLKNEKKNNEISVPTLKDLDYNKRYKDKKEDNVNLNNKEIIVKWKK